MKIEISTVPDVMLYHDISLVHVHLYTVGSVSASQEMYFKKLRCQIVLIRSHLGAAFPKCSALLPTMQRSEFLSF